MRKRRSTFVSAYSLLLTVVLILSSILPGQVHADSDSITVHRDEYGVPHIYADSVNDLYKAYGYVMAQDRLFQLEMFKRANEGTAAEIFGEEYLLHDEKMRRDGYSDQEIEQMIKNMDPFARQVLEDFASGIDAYVQEAIEKPEEKLSKEFSKYDMEPANWTGVDVLRIYMASMTAFMDQEIEVENAQLLAGLIEEYGEDDAKKIFNDIVWVNDPASPVSSDSKADSRSGTPFGDYLSDQSSSEALEEVASIRHELDQQTTELGIPLKIGSNAIVVGEEKSETGNPIMFGGPQVGFSAPGFIYEVGLHTQGFNMQGSSFIGYPFIMFGTNDVFSVGATAGYGDVVDVFQEQLNPNNPNEYLFNDKWHSFETKTEKFQVKQDDGTMKEVTKQFEYSTHGPVIYKDEEAGIAYTKQWAFDGTEADSWAAYLNMNWAENIDEFEKAAYDYTMSLNWFYSDIEGNIGYFHVGQTPKRDERIDWRLPTPGTGEYEWQGFNDPKNNPKEINPERGYIANWNNKPAPLWNTNERNSRWGINNRVHKLIDGIEEKDKLTIDDVNDVNYAASFANLNEKWFKPFLMTTLENGNDPLYEELYKEFAEWNGLNEDADGDGFYDDPIPNLVLDAWIDELSNNVFGELVSGDQSSLLLRILQEDDAALPAEYDWLKDTQKKYLMATSLEQAIDQLQKDYGDSLDDWKTPINTMKFGEDSLVGVPHGLGDDTEIIVMNRGSENHYVEITPDGPKGVNVTPPGQIGFVSQNGEYSQHYRDQISLYENFEYKPMLFNKADVEKSTVDTVHLSFDEPVVAFEDVDTTNAHYDGITHWYEQGVIKGYIIDETTNAYKPDENISRAHTALLLDRVFDLETPNNIDKILKEYKDVTGKTMYRDQIAATTERGIFQGSNGYFLPDENITREQIATVLVNAYNLEGTKSHTKINLDGVDVAHKDNVQILADLGITNQLDDFRPQEPMTRGQFATFLYNVEQIIEK